MPPKGKTDRQTLDSKTKGTWWGPCTTFNEVEIACLQESDRYPEWVQAVHGGLEKCPDTGRVHFQGAIQCKRQVRFSALKQWLPTTHIELAVSKEAVAKYCMKKETAVGEKVVRENLTEYWPMDRLFMEIAKHALDYRPTFDAMIIDGKVSLSKVVDAEFWNSANCIIDKEPFRVSMFATPQVKTIWSKTRKTWISKAAEVERGDSITPPADPPESASFRITLRD